jgi:UDP-N-acetylmuramoyl-tripeptide--D-alanyl-D-alanine ligase
MRFRASDVAAATGGRLVGPDVAIEGASFDSRGLVPGQLFVPIVADRDGHDFIPEALAAGAAAYLTGKAAGEGTAIEVPDTLQALADLAAARRGTLSATVIGITGSVGKTSTKDLARAALASCRLTYANDRSFNNEQGLPTTILNTPDDVEVLLLEMGMRGFGEIAALCQVARPSIGIVTRVAEAHGDRLGGVDGVAKAKAEMIEALPAGGVAILNADDPRVAAMAGVAPGLVVTFGESAGADVRVDDVRLDALARPAFSVVTPWGDTEVTLRVSGRHMAVNAAAALAAVAVVGGSLDDAAAALGAAELSAMRMEVRRAPAGVTVLDDSYNANPTSMRAALDALAAIDARRRVAVLGVMAEIGDAAAEHRAVAVYAAARDITVIAVGTGLYGPDPVDGIEGALAALGDLSAGDAVLVKGSRVAALDRLARALTEPET